MIPFTRESLKLLTKQRSIGPIGVLDSDDVAFGHVQPLSFHDDLSFHFRLYDFLYSQSRRRRKKTPSTGRSAGNGGWGAVETPIITRESHSRGCGRRRRERGQRSCQDSRSHSERVHERGDWEHLGEDSAEESQSLGDDVCFGDCLRSSVSYGL